MNTEETEHQNTEEAALGRVARERDDYLAGWQRAKADFANYKKDEARRIEEFAKMAAESIIEDCIGVLDNFDLAIAAMEKTGSVEKGIYLIRTQFADILKKRGLERVNVAPGDAFDPGVMEAIAEVEAEWPPGSVADLIEPGYRLQGKVIRPVRVRIVKEPTAP